ncbi:TPA: protein YmiD, partial [Escherichia coli]
ATANYHPGIRYIMTEYSAKYIYSSTYARFR